MTLPEPDPVAPATTVIHAALLLAVHAQPEPALTVLEPVPPELPNVWPVGTAEYEQAAPDCVTVKIAPAIVSVPVRLDVEVLAATEKAALPVPEPDAPLVTVIQVAFVVALQAQFAGAVTDVPPLPPAAVNDWLEEAMLYEQLAGACVTLKVAPAIVNDPVRLMVPGLAGTLKPVVPEPDPDAPLVIVIHEALLAAVQAQPAGAVTPLAPEPPAAVKDWLDGSIV